ncbi:MAG: glycosyltransferase family A protein [Patescibacteria group bacterium]|jgi:glycosyltransferase involved in cell wall biosynthesis|nr:glycosyltransferase family A protein [Patescibacteria group bacterium]
MISIIIPVYNQADKISYCLDSIIKQTYKHYEIIVVNDGSKDKISDVLNSYQRKFSTRFKIINQENQGSNFARNNGFKFARGEFLLFCDADIVLREDFLEKMLHALKQSGRSYAYSSHKFGFKNFSLWKFDEARLKQMPYIHTSSLIKKDDFPGFDENIKRLQDWDLWLTMLENGKKGIWIDEVLFEVESGGTMSSWTPSFTYKLFPFLPKVIKYKKSVAIIKNKHNLK